MNGYFKFGNTQSQGGGQTESGTGTRWAENHAQIQGNWQMRVSRKDYTMLSVKVCGQPDRESWWMDSVDGGVGRRRECVTQCGWRS